jgi:hypothetical protein
MRLNRDFLSACIWFVMQLGIVGLLLVATGKPGSFVVLP